MKRVVITGGRGFIGRNLALRLSRIGGMAIEVVGSDAAVDEWRSAVGSADVVFHLAGVNRPADPKAFMEVNAGFTRDLCRFLEDGGRRPVLVLSSSTQAACDNPYGRSKLEAEAEVRRYVDRTGATAWIFRLTNVFGKWCRPNYNSVVATFCHNAARGLPLTVNDPARLLELVFVDDVCTALIRAGIDGAGLSGIRDGGVDPVHRISLGDLARMISSFAESRKSLLVPDFSDPLMAKMHSTYLSYIDGADLAYGLSVRHDDRGCLAEFVKSSAFGQVFVSRTRPGITRGNHYHHLKTEKFLVLEGEARIGFRRLSDGEVAEHVVKGEDMRVVDIPPGSTHSITNIGRGELVTLFWASEVFDPSRPDTYSEPVHPIVNPQPGQQSV